MTKQEALEYLSEGHSMWSVETAKKVCEAFGFTLPDTLIMRWKNQKDANPDNDPKGFWLNDPNKPGEGVPSFRLSNWITDKLELKVHEFFGRGTQSRANAEAIKAHLNI